MPKDMGASGGDHHMTFSDGLMVSRMIPLNCCSEADDCTKLEERDEALDEIVIVTILRFDAC